MRAPTGQLNQTNEQGPSSRNWVIGLLGLLMLVTLSVGTAQAEEVTFDAAKDYGTVHSPQLADLDNDGDLDLVGLSYDTVGKLYTPMWQENQGDTRTVHLINDWQCYGIDLIVADLDGDGDLDLLTISSGIISYPGNLSHVAWLENSGGKSPTFTPHSLLSAISGYGIAAFTTADLDRDGDLDIIAAYRTTGETDNGLLMGYENDGQSPPSFTAHLLAETTRPYAPPAYDNTITTADIDGDGWTDVMLGTDSWGTKWYKNNKNWKTAFTMYPLSDAVGQLKAADINGDGRMDVMVGYSWAKNIGDTPTSFTTQMLGSDFKFEIYDRQQVAVGDLNGDGHVDVVTYNPSYPPKDSNLYAFINDGQTSPSFTRLTISTAPYTMNTTARNPALGDYDGDGNLDLFATDYDNTTNMFFHNLNTPRPVSLLAPNDAGRAYASGGGLNVYWRTDLAQAGSAVRLELWRGEEKMADLGSAYNAQGSGYERVTVPPVPPGGPYRLRVVSTWAPQYWDQSTEPFVVSNPQNAVQAEAWPAYQ